MYFSLGSRTGAVHSHRGPRRRGSWRAGWLTAAVLAALASGCSPAAPTNPDSPVPSTSVTASPTPISPSPAPATSNPPSTPPSTAPSTSTEPPGVVVPFRTVVPNTQAAALAGLGKVALARRDYGVAVERLEQALELRRTRPNCSSRLPWRTRGWGTRRKRRSTFASSRWTASSRPSTTRLRMHCRTRSLRRVLLRRGQRAGKSGRFDLAEKAFRAAIAADPDDAEAIANLGISLANLDASTRPNSGSVEALRKDDSIVVAH